MRCTEGQRSSWAALLLLREVLRWLAKWPLVIQGCLLSRLTEGLIFYFAFPSPGVDTWLYMEPHMLFLIFFLIYVYKLLQRRMLMLNTYKCPRSCWGIKEEDNAIKQSLNKASLDLTLLLLRPFCLYKGTQSEESLLKWRLISPATLEQKNRIENK